MSLRKIFLAVVLAASLLPAQARKTKNIVLVTADGLRWQEIFGGIDPLLMESKEASMNVAGNLRKMLWAETPEERRKLLMPFFWGTLVPRGVLLGNVKKGSSVKVTNRYRVSYPGYSEILTGQAQDEAIRGNDKVQNPSVTVLEFLRTKLRLDRPQVALFASWEHFTWIGEHNPDSIIINAGYKNYEGPANTARMRELSHLQYQMLTPWESARHDHITADLALEYLKNVKPRALYVSFDETDDWAHEKRYAWVLDAIRRFDRFLKDLCSRIDLNTTSLVITADHGRGGTAADWHDHGARTVGAEQIWLAIAGPDTPAQGEAVDVPEFFQRDVTPTILSLLGIDPAEMKGIQGKPIPLALKK